MSNAMPSSLPERDVTAYLDDMLDFCERVCRYTAGQQLDTWLADAMRYDATLRNLELIGEAATRVPADIRDMAPDIPWRLVIGTRNRLAHAYLGIEPEIIWTIVEDKVPALQQALWTLLERLRTG